jgi:hypothetical protein
MGKEFKISREVELSATPEQVFAAVTTGTAGWMFPIEVPPAAGDGGGPGAPTVTANPPGEFSVRVEGPDGWFNALEYLIEARAGGTAVLRYVHAGIFADDWDSQYDGVSLHTDFYLHTLGQYLKYFDARPVTYLAAAGPAASARPDAMDQLRTALGLGADAAPGDQVRLDLPGGEPVDAVVDYLTPQFVGLRGSDALYRFFGRNAFGGTVDLAHHVFAVGVDQEKAGDAWQSWLESVYA